MMKYKIDRKRTAELNQPELQVLAGRGDKDHFHCVLISSKARPACPYCGSANIRNQGTVHREYLDLIKRNDDVEPITVSLEFRKSKCMREGCGTVYYPEFSFASPYARTTRRLDDVIVRMVLAGSLSYTEIAYALNGKFSRQSVGNIYKRRIRELNADSSENAAWYRDLKDDGRFWLKRAL